MENKDIISQVMAFIEQSGIKEELKKPETIEKIYGLISAQGINIGKEEFTNIAQAFISGEQKLDMDSLAKFAPMAENLGKLFSSTESGSPAEGLKDIGKLFS